MKRYEKRDIFPQTLVVKAIGTMDQIKRFINDLTCLYPRENLSYSHILRNKDNPGYHIFINVHLLSANSKEEQR